MPVSIDAEWVEQVREELPEKPFDKQRRYMADMNLPYTATSALCPDRLLCEYFEKTASLTKDPVKAANWVVNDLLRELSQAKKTRMKKTGFRLRIARYTPRDWRN